MTNSIGSPTYYPESTQYTSEPQQLIRSTFTPNPHPALKVGSKPFILYTPSPPPSFPFVAPSLAPALFDLGSNQPLRTPTPPQHLLPSASQEATHHIFQQTVPPLSPANPLVSTNRQLRERSLLKRKEYREDSTSATESEEDAYEETNKKPAKKRAKASSDSSAQNLDQSNLRKLSNRKAAQKSRLMKKMHAEALNAELKGFDLLHQEIAQVYEKCQKGDEIGNLFEEEIKVKKGLPEKQVALLRAEQRNEIRKMFMHVVKDLAEKRAYIAQIESKIAR
jgi:hypothetical protein